MERVETAGRVERSLEGWGPDGRMGEERRGMNDTKRHDLSSIQP